MSAEKKLSQLCKNGHDYQGTGKSLRYVSTNQCVECMTERRKREASTLEGKKRNAGYARDHYFLYTSSILKRQREYQQTDAYKDSQDKYRQANKEALYARTKAWKQTPEGKAACRASEARYRALKNRSSVDHYSGEERLEVFAWFSGKCAYCGETATTLDHVEPISRGGKDALNNLVPACIRCNSSKRDKDMESWYRRQSFFTEERLYFILLMTDSI